MYDMQNVAKNQAELDKCISDGWDNIILINNAITLTQQHM
jgi:hypothetical protein